MKLLTDDGKPSLDELAHYGVVGMKWGVRRGGLRSRFRGALSDLNQQRTAVATRTLEGRNKHLDEKIGAGLATAVYLGKKRRNKAIQGNLKLLGDQKKRIEKGKLKAIDYIDALQNVTMFDLMVSRRDNRG